MRIQRGLLPLFASATFLGSYLPIAIAQEPSAIAQKKEQCLRDAQSGVLPAVWERVRIYFVSLTPGNDAVGKRTRLIELRAEIVSLESAKQGLIDILEAHVQRVVSAAAVSRNLSLSEIPNLVARISAINMRLQYMAKEGDLFVAEDSFKQLVKALDAKQYDLLCRFPLETTLAPPNPSVMMELVKKLKSELAAISMAEEALAKYIKESNG